MKFNFERTATVKEEGNDYSVVGSILRFNQYLNGDSEYAHLNKKVTDGYKEEMVRYCRYFAESLKMEHDIQRMRIVAVSKKDVASFYTLMEQRFHPKTFNKCMAGVKYFFKFLIEIEEVKMKNPFETYESLSVPQTNIETLTKVEFLAILDAVMARISKAFTHYVAGAGIKKKVTLKHLRKTYITGMNQAMGLETGRLTSQTEGVMKHHYIDPKIVALIFK